MYRQSRPPLPVLASGAVVLLGLLWNSPALCKPDPPGEVRAGSVVAYDPVGKRASVTPVLFTASPSAISQPELPPVIPPHAKIDPLLAGAKASSAGPTSFEEVVITFRETLPIPRFPQARFGEPSDSPANLAARSQADRLIQRLEATRQPTRAARMLELEPLGVEVLETFWLIDAMRVKVPASAFDELAARQDVLYIEPVRTAIPPPDSNPNNDVTDARAYIRSDALASIGSGGFVGLLDTGVRSTHTLLSSPSPLRFLRDCVNGTANNCTSGSGLNPDDNFWNHGTSTAAIITGNSNLGDNYRGVDWITLDSFKVYDNAGLQTAAVLRGFQAALAALDQVIVAEMQGSGSDTSSISLAADAAFDAGAIVVAANGNFGPGSGTVNTPANAHKALGIGAFNLETLVQPGYQSRGPAPDGRIKPDVQAPTDSETASNASSTALQVFGGTSGATPYGAGLAIGWRNWAASTGAASFLPGIAYSWMILMGGQAYPSFDNVSGAGHARFVPNGLFWSATCQFTGTPGFCDIPLDTFGLSFPYNLNAAIWWPENAADPHRNVNLSIVNPGGVVQATSTSVPSVFERARVAGLLAAGTWKVRIDYSGTQTVTVYMSAYRTSTP